jgi:hypothetical protein
MLSAPVDSTVDGMDQPAPKVCAASPGKFQPKEIDDFVAFVLAGGEVTSHGLKARIVRAECISYLRNDDCLLGVAGLKSPDQGYRARVEKHSETKLPEKEFPYELGWVFILPSARDRKQSFPLCQPLVIAAKGAGIFATSRTTLKGMHRTLEKLGFVRTGSEWPSKENDGNLLLFLRHAV